MERTERPLSPKEMAAVLNTGDSTLRKWCIAIEKEGYFFSRTENKRRVFYDEERLLLHQFKHLVQTQYLSLENAAKIVASKHQDKPSEQSNTDNTDIAVRSDNKQLEQLMSFMEEQQEHIERQKQYIQRQEEFNAKLLQRLDEQQGRIEERMKERDKRLMETLEELQEQKKLEQEKPKSFWSRLFSGE